jgi:hypothetical protein
MKLNTTTQQSIILKYLQANGSMTTLQARNHLFIMHPAARVQELRAQGKNIQTVILENRVARYVLGSSKEVSHD